MLTAVCDAAGAKSDQIFLAVAGFVARSDDWLSLRALGESGWPRTIYRISA